MSDKFPKSGCESPVSEEDYGGVFTQESALPQKKRSGSKKVPEIGMSVDGIPFFLDRVKKKKRKKELKDGIYDSKYTLNFMIHTYI